MRRLSFFIANSFRFFFQFFPIQTTVSSRFLAVVILQTVSVSFCIRKWVFCCLMQSHSLGLFILCDIFIPFCNRTLLAATKITVTAFQNDFKTPNRIIHLTCSCMLNSPIFSISLAELTLLSLLRIQYTKCLSCAHIINSSRFAVWNSHFNCFFSQWILYAQT